MSIDLDALDGLEPETANDFRRGGHGVPLIKNEATGKYERYRRSSSVGKILDDETGLTDWKIRTTVEGAAQRPDLMALVSVLDHEANKREIRDLAEQCLVQGKGTQRRETGTAVHAMLDHVDRNDDWQPAPQFVAACNAYITIRDAYGLVPVDIECKCVNDVWRLAGTADRRYRTTRVLIAPDGSIIPIGTILLGDTKTGRTLEYAHGVYATQMASYAESVRYDPVTDERTPFDPPTNRDWAIIVHVGWEDGTCAIHWVDLEAGRQGVELALMVYEWRRRTDLITPARAPLHAITNPLDEPAAPMTDDEWHPFAEASGIAPGDSSAPVGHPDPITASNGVLEASAHPDDVCPWPTEADEARAEGLRLATREWLRERVANIIAKGHTATLQRMWPDGVAGLRDDVHSQDWLDRIADAVSSAERQHELSWPTADPRKVASDAWAKPQVASATNEQRDELARNIATHPRRALLDRWSAIGRARLDPTITDRAAITHALYEFALVNDEWSDDDVTEMLDGSLRAIGYEDGIDALGCVMPADAPALMGAAFAITAGTAVLVIREDGKPVVRVPSKL